MSACFDVAPYRLLYDYLFLRESVRFLFKPPMTQTPCTECVCVCALQTNSEGHCFPSVILLQGQSVTSRPNALVVLWDKVKAPVKKKGSSPVFLCRIMRTALTPPAGRPRPCFLSSETSRWWRRENIHQETCGRYFIPQTPGDISEADWKLKWPFRACHGACNVICCPTHTPASYSHHSLLSLIAPA